MPVKTRIAPDAAMIASRLTIVILYPIVWLAVERRPLHCHTDLYLIGAGKIKVWR